MKNVVLAWVAVLFLMIASPVAHARGSDSGDVWLVSGGTSAGLNFQSGTPNTSTFDLSLGVGHSIGSFELFALASYIRTSIEGLLPISSSEFDIQLVDALVGGHADALYVGPRIGFRNSDNGVSTSTTTLFGGVIGKRFELGGAVSYDPNFSIMFAHDSQGFVFPAYHFVPLELTLVF